MRTQLISIISFFFLISFNSQAQSIKDFGQILEPKFNIDMSQYPGMHPARAFELESFKNASLPGKIEMIQQAIDATKTNITIDRSEGENTDTLEQELKRLERQLQELKHQLEPSV